MTDAAAFLTDIISARMVAAVFIAFVAGFFTGVYVMERTARR